MISKIVQKEKEQQEEILKGLTNRRTLEIFKRNAIRKYCHKQSLINLKEHFEEELSDFDDVEPSSTDEIIENHLKENISELNKMIERYK